MQIPPLYRIDNGGCDARLAAVNQVASWTWRDRGTRAKPFRALAKTPPPRLVARDIKFSFAGMQPVLELTSSTST